MNTAEYLLTCLAEEGSEVAKAATKTMRFGPDSGYTQASTNADDITKEVCDVIAVYELLQELGVVTQEISREVIEGKKKTLSVWMEHSRQAGCLRDIPEGVGP